ncbi:hypothetical protein BZA70DRAFT_276691 [Myxozyma melibiosi]|uniref:Uncharacterized protein n=1 Tax=Myxozyma melibiosi TaxID=54550 RepID=A0ABR1F777_9ASCO
MLVSVQRSNATVCLHPSPCCTGVTECLILGLCKVPTRNSLHPSLWISIIFYPAENEKKRYRLAQSWRRIIISQALPLVSRVYFWFCYSFCLFIRILNISGVSGDHLSCHLIAGGFLHLIYIYCSRLCRSLYNTAAFNRRQPLLL